MNKRRLAARAGLILEDLVKGRTNFVQQEFARSRLTQEELRKIKRASDTLSWNCKQALELPR